MDNFVWFALGALLVIALFKFRASLRTYRKDGDKGAEIQRKLERLRKKRNEE
ncbi:hypothetical protein [Paenibacillus eucommiae]|uniref:DUF4083 domain-containing protein n=1 Tax=Paenibacillus eucommiae TaxID=1355755 RepID=A0ABS4IZT3_9BACL|nr:hypothetical protein [Paenibacillus eucommiae]MBP1992039.1 hypothetical protein [Paenibacillus eucommiae]